MSWASAPVICFVLAAVWHGMVASASPLGVVVAAGRLRVGQTTVYATGRNSTYSFDGAAWQVGRIAPMPDGLVDGTSVHFNGQLWCLGGVTGSAETSSTRVVALATDGQTWQLQTSLLAPRQYSAAAVLNNTIVIAGGLDDGYVFPSFCERK
jgi:N-acetylneuraminic acid mutarotase